MEFNILFLICETIGFILIVREIRHLPLKNYFGILLTVLMVCLLNFYFGLMN